LSLRARAANESRLPSPGSMITSFEYATKLVLEILGIYLFEYGLTERILETFRFCFFLCLKGRAVTLRLRFYSRFTCASLTSCLRLACALLAPCLRFLGLVYAQGTSTLLGGEVYGGVKRPI
jgi:hypothetical protein